MLVVYDCHVGQGHRISRARSIEAVEKIEGVANPIDRIENHVEGWLENEGLNKVGE